MEAAVLRGVADQRSGDGYGYGYGSGSGYGYGDGSGYGSGSGYGYGDGYGYGSGSGDGYGDGYWEAVLTDMCVQRKLDRSGATLAFWRSDPQGWPCNGGSGTIAAPSLIEEIAGPLQLCSRNALHATLDPSKWKGERLWVVALYGEIQKEDDKLGALKREILFEVTNG